MSVKYKKVFIGDFIPIELSQLRDDEKVTFNIYADENGKKNLVVLSGCILSKALKERLKSEQVEILYVSSQEKDLLKNYLIKERIRKDKTFHVEKYKQYLEIKENFFEIEKRLLLIDRQIPFSLYIPESLDFVCLLEANEKKPQKIPEELLESDKPIFIKASELPLYNEYINSVLLKSLDSSLKAFALKENSKIVLKELLNDPRSKKVVSKVKNLAQNVVSTIVEDKEALFNLLSLRDYDYYTYTHSVNVCVLSIGLGKSIGISHDELEELSIGSMLHDIGKSMIPKYILNKPGRLTYEEFLIMKSHVLRGEELLKEH